MIRQYTRREFWSMALLFHLIPFTFAFIAVIDWLTPALPVTGLVDGIRVTSSGGWVTLVMLVCHRWEKTVVLTRRDRWLALCLMLVTYLFLMGSVTLLVPLPQTWVTLAAWTALMLILFSAGLLAIVLPLEKLRPKSGIQLAVAMAAALLFGELMAGLFCFPFITTDPFFLAFVIPLVSVSPMMADLEQRYRLQPDWRSDALYFLLLGGGTLCMLWLFAPRFAIDPTTTLAKLVFWLLMVWFQLLFVRDRLDRMRMKQALASRHQDKPDELIPPFRGLSGGEGDNR